MNKHAIILPMLLTSAVSLHVLSFYLEEPEMIVDVPTPIVTPAETIQNSVSPSTTVNVNTKVSTNPSSTGTEVKVVVKNSSTPSVQPPVQVVVSPNVSIPQATATPDPNAGIQVAAALIPTKNYDDMVREAKQIGGRVDPFLSMKPPEIEEIPEIPVPSITPAPVINNSKPLIDMQRRPGFGHRGTIPRPPTPWIPNNTSNNSSNTVRPGNVGQIAVIQKNNSGKTTITIPANNPKTNITTTTIKTNPSQNTVVIIPEVKMTDGLELTGIITGNKPLALIKVDSESKVFKIGDVIRQDGRVKIVSIDFENGTVTLVNALNKRTRLSIK